MFMMKTKKISRRTFVKNTALSAGALALTACASSNPGPAQAPVALSSLKPEFLGKALKISIVYDSVYGNTQQIAQAMQAALAAGNDVRLFKADQAAASDVLAADLILIGSPTHGGFFTEPVKKLFASIAAGSLQGKYAAAFDTSTSKQGENWFVKGVIDFFGHASTRIAKELTDRGAVLLAADTFLVVGQQGPIIAGELERAQAWAKALLA